MSDQLLVERAGLEKKDKGELQAIVTALGGKASSRVRKADLIEMVLELSGAKAAASPSSDETASSVAPADGGDTASRRNGRRDISGGSSDGQDRRPSNQSQGGGRQSASSGNGSASTAAAADSGAAAASGGAASSGAPAATSGGAASSGGGANSGGRAEDSGQRSRQSTASGKDDSRASRGNGNGNGTGNGGGATGSGRRGGGRQGTSHGGHPVGPDGEPLADWEIEIAQSEGAGGSGGDAPQAESAGTNKKAGSNANEEEIEPNNRKNRRRGRGRGRDRDDNGNNAIVAEPIAVEGYLDLRDEGYGFLRVNNYLPSKDDVYVSVKQVRQFGLRRGDHLTGTSRPAVRNEKNPGFHQIDTVNGAPPVEHPDRVSFDAMTPVFPFEPLTLEMTDEPDNMILRVIDLVSPIGRGQRGVIMAPPKSGRTTVIRQVARGIEANHPDVHLLVLLIDERPEEVTEIRDSLARAEVISSTFDRPPEEHIAVAELTVERAKRLVEAGQHVCILADGLTRMARAYNLTAPQSGRPLPGGVDAAAVYPSKRFFGAARKVAEGGSLTMLATMSVGTGTGIDEQIQDEFSGTANMELWLDRDLAQRSIRPSIDVQKSATLMAERIRENYAGGGDPELIDARLRAVWEDPETAGSAASATEALVQQLKQYPTNDEFLANLVAK